MSLKGIETLRAALDDGNSPFESSMFYQNNMQHIAHDENAVRVQLAEGNLRGKGARTFFTLPFSPKKNSYRLCFFRPKFRVDAKECDIEVVLIGDDSAGSSIGFRYERGLEGENDTHGYSHVQLTRVFSKDDSRKVETELPEFCEVSYPAFPLPRGSTYSTWPLVLVSLAGFSTGGKVGLKRNLDDMADLLPDTRLHAFEDIHEAAHRLIYR